jgi:hypothetical protein
MRAVGLSLTIVAVGVVGFGRFAPIVGQERQPDEPKPAEGFTLKTAETIEFSTDEATWMQVDVSPDGRRSVRPPRDPGTLPISGGEATRIMGGLSFEPAYLVARRQEHRVSHRLTGVENLWVANADGSNPRA